MTFGSVQEIADFMSDARQTVQSDSVAEIVYDNTPDDFYFPAFH